MQSLVKLVSVAMLGGVVLTACPKVELNADRAAEIQTFSRQAVTSSTSFLKGVPVGALDIGRRLEAQAMSHEKSRAFIQKYAPRLSKQFSSVRLQNYSGCASPGPAQGTDYNDVDNDGIPVNLNGSPFVFTFVNCSETVIDDNTGAQTTATVTGSVSFKDANDNDPSSGYTFSANNFKFTYASRVDDGASGTIPVTLSLTLNGSDTVTGSNGTYQDAQNTQFSFDATGGTDFVRVSFSTNSTLTFTTDTANSDGDDFSVGYLNSNSKFTYNISAKLGNQTGSAGGEFNMKLINVYINRFQCPDDVTDSGVTGKDGAITFGDDSNNVLKYDLTSVQSGGACGEGSWTYNGTPQ
jgi:hypothetical protein